MEGQRVFVPVLFAPSNIDRMTTMTPLEVFGMPGSEFALGYRGDGGSAVAAGGGC